MDRRRRALADPGQPPTWLVWLAALLLVASMVLWPLVTGRTLTEWMRDVTGAIVRGPRPAAGVTVPVLLAG